MKRRPRKTEAASIDLTAGLSAAEIARYLETNTQTAKFHTKGGHGFAAEDANALADRLRGRRVEVTGTNCALNGADRVVNGVSVQTKYFQSAAETLGAAFDPQTGLYRYEGQRLEVPRDQFDRCVAGMRARIAAGKVPGVTDPAAAEAIVCPGEVTYRQARNLARAGNIESLTFDAQTQAVTCGYVLGISFLVHYAGQWRAGNRDAAAVAAALRGAAASGATSLVSGVLTAQLLRTKAAAVGAVTMRGGVRLVHRTGLGKATIEKLALASLRKPVFGAAALNHVAKLARSNVLAATVTTAVTAAPDFYRAAVARSISWQQMGKNLAVNAAGVAGGAAGWMGGAAAGAALGSVMPIVGTVAGGIVGGIIGSLAGGAAGAAGAKAAADRFVEDDARAMLRLVESAVGELAYDHLLTEAEIGELGQEVQTTVNPRWLQEMYRSGNAAQGAGIEPARQTFAYDRLDGACLAISQRRAAVPVPEAAVLRVVLEEVVAVMEPPLVKPVSENVQQVSLFLLDTPPP